MFCPLFFSTIVCDLIFDGGSYLQFAVAHDDNDGGVGDDADGDDDDSENSNDLISDACIYLQFVVA